MDLKETEKSIEEGSSEQTFSVDRKWACILRWCGLGLVGSLVFGCLFYFWGMIFYSGPFSQGGWGNGLLGLCWLGAMVVVFFRVQRWRLRAILWLSGLLMVLAPYLMIYPANDKEWEPEFARTGYAAVEGDVVTLYHVRNFEHRGKDDFVERWESRTFHLSKLRGLDYFQSNFYGDMLAHPILSFDFGDQGRICLSVETRREVGEKFTPFGGLYKMFELQYLFVTEEDCIPLRTQIRKEIVRRYVVQGDLEKIREMFLTSVRVQNQLLNEPRFYNVLRSNCTTSLRAQRPRSDRMPWDLRLLLNGRLDAFLYEQGVILTNDLPFEQLREQAMINAAVSEAVGKESFSQKIRE